MIIDYDKLCWYEDAIPYFENPTNENLIYIQMHNTGYYYPINMIDSNSEKVVGSDVLYNILTKTHPDNLKNVYYVNSDALLYENYKKVKNSIDYVGTDINLFKYPLIHLMVLLSDESKINYKKPKIDKKYNFVFLNRTQKIARVYFLSKFHDHQKFVFSNLNVINEADGVKKLNSSRRIKEILFDDEHAKLIFENNNIQNHIPETILKNFYFDNNKFDSRQIVELNEQEFRKDLNNFLNEEIQCVKNIPQEYEQSFFELVCESNITHGISITEKTFKSILYQKPFLTIASKNYYKELKKLGFLLYDEIFDYSFDTMNLSDRIESIENQVNNILNYDLNKCEELLSIVEDKMLYNVKILFDLFEHNKKYFDIDMTNVREHLDIVRKYNKNFINLFLRNYDIR